MPYSPETLLRKSSVGQSDSTILNSVTAEQAGWEMLNFEVRRLAKGDVWNGETKDCELGLVVLGGSCGVSSSRGNWERIGSRPDVFAGKAEALYLPRRTSFELNALTDNTEIAACRVPTDEDHPAQQVNAEDNPVELRGGGSASRQINSIFPPGFDCHRLVCVEVYTPSGNWSSYPPHKHDVHREDANGHVIEADLEEIYFYKMQKPTGFAVQRVYTDDRSLDATMAAGNNDMVLVPYGYHPVSAAHGYHCYYLNFLAGSAQSLANQDDPDLAWIKDSWNDLDPRVPMV